MTHITEWIKSVDSSMVYITISFALNIATGLTLAVNTVKLFRNKAVKAKELISITALKTAMYLLIALIVPLLTIILSWGLPFSWLLLGLQLLAWSLLIGFIVAFGFTVYFVLLTRKL